MNVKCKIIKKVYANEDYRIFSCRPVGISDVKVNKYGTFSIVGNLSYLVEGQTCDLNLTDEECSKYGYSYHVDSCSSLTSKEITPEVAMGIMCEITSKAQAKYVLSAYPNFIQMVLDGKENEIDVKKIYNVKEYRLAVYCRELREKFKFLKIIQENKQYELTNSECKELVRRFDTIDEVNKQLKENPYVCLVQYLQRNFEQIDPIILGCNNSLRLSFQRTESLICYILQLNEKDGSTVISANDMAKHCIDIAPELTSQIVQITKDSQAIYYNEETKQTALMSTYLQECELAQFIKEKLAQDNKWDINWKKYQTVENLTLTDTQLNALKNVCENNISLLIGYAGSGKSSATKAILQMADDNNLTYKIVSPTAKAARRINEITDRPSSTIHRLCLSDNEFYCDLLLVDETSMVDLPTFCMLLRCIGNKDCHVLLVGDNAQLLPVGVGNIFNDIINTNIIPTTKLTEIFRYSDKGISYVTTCIREGKPFFNGYESQQLSDNYKFIQTDNIVDVVVDEYMNLINQGVSTSNIMCLSPYNVGDCGSYAINNKIQETINPTIPHQEQLAITKGKTKIHFRKGDIVLCKKNDYDAISYQPTNKKIAVFNGQDGKVIKVEDDTLVIQFDDDVVVYPKNKLNELLLGYCVSCHASQGSESQYVISITSPLHKRMLNKNLCYVSSSRSKGTHIEIGDIATMNQAIVIDGNEERKTMLKEMLSC